MLHFLSRGDSAKRAFGRAVLLLKLQYDAGARIGWACGIRGVRAAASEYLLPD